MYAIVKVGGKQYNIKQGDVIEVEKQEAQEGEEITLKEVLFLSNKGDVKIGKPFLSGAQITAVVLKQTQGPKVISFKYRRRKAYHKKTGHRQKLTRLQIKEIAG